MNLRFASFSHIGPRSSNQDRILVPSTAECALCVAAIADGIGGSDGGDLAAKIAIDEVISFDGDMERLESVFISSVEKMKLKSISDVGMLKMGTTLSVAVIGSGVVRTAHVGDTRIYHIRGSGIRTLTVDQTEVAELLRRGVLSESQARRYGRKGVLLSALSPAGNYEIQYNEAELSPGDRLLLLSDGVYQKLSRGAILNRSLGHEDIDDFVKSIEQEVEIRKPSDNYSAVGLEIVSL